MGFDELLKDGEQAMDGQTTANAESANQSSGSGNMAAENTVADSMIDQVASKEGLPAGMDPEVNNLVNSEIDKL